MALETEAKTGYSPPTQAESWVFFNGEFQRYKDVHLGLMTHALHYGTGCFEGIRAYWNEAQEQMFCLLMEDHFKRLQLSAKILQIDLPYSVAQMSEATVEIMRRNGWREDIYVRPLAFKSDEKIGVKLKGIGSSFGIYASPFGNYVDVDSGIHCKVSSWRRVDDNAAPARAKVTGIYINSALAKSDAEEDGYDEAIVLNQDGHVSEGSAANIFLVKDGVLLTPPASDNILEGVTRRALMTLAREDLGIATVERSIDRTELYVADEAFLCGTGVQVSPILSVDHRQVGDGTAGPITKELQQLYFDVAKGRVEERLGWLTPIY
ncbi:MAG TPA: branched-chain amino acid transaminase [Candidatus Dormibacteraeota bacterium]|nr:branched-chain amino acid transaminase [Candidatus Dormibacteraeota bacterium]